MLLKTRTSQLEYLQCEPKNGLYFGVDNFVIVIGRKACNMPKVSKFYPEINYKIHVSELNTLCLICKNHETPELMVRLTRFDVDCAQFSLNIQ